MQVKTKPLHLLGAQLCVIAFALALTLPTTSVHAATAEAWVALGSIAPARNLPRFDTKKAATECLEKTPGDTFEVYYASYGSNLDSNRLRLYIEGGQMPGLSRKQDGARDPSPPRDSLAVLYPGRVFFGPPFAGSWGEGGVMFLDPSQTQSTRQRALLRLYRVTLAQLEDIVLQENDRGVSDAAAHAQLHLTREKVCELSARSRRDAHASLPMGLGGLYDHLLVIAEHESVPVVTFTCSPAQRRYYAQQRKGRCHQPAPAYRRIIASGLRACGQSDAWVERYLHAAACDPLQ